MTLQKCIEIAKREEISSTQLKLIAKPSEENHHISSNSVKKSKKLDQKQRNMVAAVGIMTPTAIKCQQSRASTVELNT